MVHHAGNEQCGYGVEYADLGRPLDRVRLAGSGRQGTMKTLEMEEKRDKVTSGQGLVKRKEEADGR